MGGPAGSAHFFGDACFTASPRGGTMLSYAGFAADHRRILD
jgi:hypothetical protein